MNRVYLLLGSNKGNSEALLNEAVPELIDALLPDYLEAESLADAVNTSDILKSAPWGEFDSSEGPVNDFSNMAMAICTELSPEQVLDACQEVEKRMGRGEEDHRCEKEGKELYRSRSIDIDILLFETLVPVKRQAKAEKSAKAESETRKVWRSIIVESPRLSIPHKLLSQRRFALDCLAQIAPNAYHPVERKRVRDLNNKSDI